MVLHRQTVSLYHNLSVWLDTEDASSWDRNQTYFTLDLVSNCTAISAPYVSSRIITLFCISFHLFTFCDVGCRRTQFIRRALYYTGGSRLSLRQLCIITVAAVYPFAELCIITVAAVYPFARVLNPRDRSVYIVIHRQIAWLITTVLGSYTSGMLQAGIETRQTLR